MKQLILSLSLLILCGCTSTWRDPKLGPTPSSSAVLIVEKRVQSGLVLEKIDDKRRGIGSFIRYELSPTEHTLTVALNEPFAVGDKLFIHFTPKAGQTYHIEKSIDYKRRVWQVWVTDAAAGEKFYGEASKR